MPVIDLTVGDMHVTNLPTNIRTWDGGDRRRTGQLHLRVRDGGIVHRAPSHLHHLLEPADLAALGHIDIVMVAVDGLGR